MNAHPVNPSLADLMDRHTVVGAPDLWHAEGDHVRCLACGHRCLIGVGRRGICKVRLNDAGQLKVPHGYVSGLQADPVEKKPFFHVYPGCTALTFGMLGCDLHCPYCQNWVTSQALRDSQATGSIHPITAAQLAATAHREGARLVVSSYNEPLITTEWAVSVFREATELGLSCAFVSNGNATPEVLEFLRPWIVAYKVDLKSFHDRHYRSLGCTLESVTRSIRLIHEHGLWLEVVTLVIPGFNDSEDELRRTAAFLASVSPDIPWHVTAFHKDYHMTDPEATSAAMLVRAAEIGVSEGLHFVYAGNLPGQIGPWENTRCPSCRATLIERSGYRVGVNRLTPQGCCPHCQATIPGLWANSTETTGGGWRGWARLLPSLADKESLAGASPSRATRHPPPATLQPPGLTTEQKQQVVQAVTDMLRATVAGEAPIFPAGWTDLRDHRVAGAFVSLKRGRHLRSCCGLFGPTVSLAQALEQATVRTVWEDSRFPRCRPPN